MNTKTKYGLIAMVAVAVIILVLHLLAKLLFPALVLGAIAGVLYYFYKKYSNNNPTDEGQI